MDNQKAAVLRRGRKVRAAREAVAVLGLCVLSAFSAIIVKSSMVRHEVTPLAMVNDVETSEFDAPAIINASLESIVEVDSPAADPLNVAHETTVVAPDASEPALPENAITDTSIRFFNGRPVRPARTIRMKVTAYSPDEESCGDSADGITSSLHDVWTNAGKLVAADSRVLPLGSIISVPGYDNGQVVPVLDRGGAIKGKRLDLLYPTHSQARKWGVQTLEVTVWEYADGKPADDFRAIRDSRN
jgi:3D (Asp-Asp-Asp) domain-containing protein